MHLIQNTTQHTCSYVIVGDTLYTFKVALATPMLNFCNPNAHFVTQIFVNFVAIQTELGTGGPSWGSWENVGAVLGTTCSG